MPRDHGFQSLSGVPRRPPPSFVFMFVGAWGFLTLHLVDEWWNNPQYGYGFLVPLLCSFMIWCRREEVLQAFSQSTPFHPASTVTRMLLLAGALLLLPIELLRQVSPSLRSIGALGTVACMVMTYWTLRQLGAKRIPGIVGGTALLFCTAIPWPTSFETFLTQALMKSITEINADFLNLAGILAISRGNVIELKSGIVNVSEACSGVRSLQSCVMASVALSLYFHLSLKRGFLLAGSGVILAFLGNLIRTLILTLSAAWYGPASVHRLHDPAGWTILGFVTLLLFGAARRLGEIPNLQARSTLPTLGKFVTSIPWERLPSTRWVCVIGMFSLIAAHLWFLGHDRFWPPQDEPFLILQKGNPYHIQQVQVPQEIWDTLQPERGSYYQGYDEHIGDIAIYDFFWLPGEDNRVSFFHRPDICMTGVGWKMLGEVVLFPIRIGSRETLWYLFRFERGTQQVIQAWGVWRDGVEQRLNFSKGLKGFWGQQIQRWNWIRSGRRTANTQIVSVIIGSTSPVDGASGAQTPSSSPNNRPQDEIVLKNIIERLFLVRGEIRRSL